MAARVPRKATKKAIKAAVVTPLPSKLPSVITLTTRSLALLRANMKLFAGIGAWYAFCSLFLGAITINGYDVASVRDQLGGHISGSLSTYVSLLGASTGTGTQAGQVYGFVLFVVFSLAIIWTLRQLHEKSVVRIRDAYYKGMYPLVPFVLILLVALLALMPVLIGSGLYQAVASTGSSRYAYETVLWLAVVLATMLLSLYFIIVPILALYVATLPNMQPMTALRTAKRLVAGRRWVFVRKMLFLPVVLVMLVGIVMVPVIFLVPAAAQFLLALLGVMAIIVAHAYLYELYRSSME